MAEHDSSRDPNTTNTSSYVGQQARARQGLSTTPSGTHPAVDRANAGPSTSSRTRMPPKRDIGPVPTFHGAGTPLGSAAGLQELTARLSMAMNTTRADGSTLEVAGEENRVPRYPAPRRDGLIPFSQSQEIRDDMPLSVVQERPRPSPALKKWAKAYDVAQGKRPRKHVPGQEAAAKRLASLYEARAAERMPLRRQKSSESIKTAYGPDEEVPASAYRHLNDQDA